MNKNLNRLLPYPFERLNDLLKNVKTESNLPLISWSVGEPKHPAPKFLIELMKNENFIRQGFEAYPPTKGLPELRQAISGYLKRRHNLTNEPNSEHQVLPVAGTREALFSFAQVVLSPTDDSVTVIPNPFYQIYEGAALLAGSRPYYVNNRKYNGMPDFDSIPDAIWRKCQLLFICNPGNPSGAVLGTEALSRLIKRSEAFDFVIASDECYSEIYSDEYSPPPGLLEVADQIGHKNYKNCVVFNSLSKRSNIPGVRSGYVAGDAELLERFLLYRTYHGTAMPLHHQYISAAAWKDDTHVSANSQAYSRNFKSVTRILNSLWSTPAPKATFYLWPSTPIDDELFTQRLLKHANIRVLPGSFLSRETSEGNPGKNKVRIALVATEKECVDAAQRIVETWPKLVKA